MKTFYRNHLSIQFSFKALIFFIALLCFSDSKAQKLKALFESDFRVMEMLYLTYVDNSVLFTAEVIKNVNTRPMVYKYGLDKGQLSTFYQGELGGQNFMGRIGMAGVGQHFSDLEKGREGQIASIETGRSTGNGDIDLFLKIFDDNKGTIKKEISYPEGRTPLGGKLLFTSDNCLLVAVSKMRPLSPPGQNIDVYKFDSELNLAWKKEIPEKGYSYAPVSSCIETIDGGYLVSGGHVNKTKRSSNGTPLFTKLSVEGEVLWSYKMSENGTIWGGIENSKGSIFAIGTSDNKGGLLVKKGGELTVAKLTRRGEPIWTYKRESNSKLDDVVTSFFIDEQTEEILILGYFANGNVYEFGLIRLDKNGNELIKLNLNTVEKIELANYDVNYTEAQAIKTEDYILVAARIYDKAKSGSVTKLYQLKPSGEVIYEEVISGEPGTSMFPFGIIQIDDDKFVVGCWKKSKRAKRYKQSTVSLYQLNLQK